MGAACREAPEEAAPPDAGARFVEVREAEAGLAFRLPRPWRLEPSPEAPSAPADRRTLASLRRPSEASRVRPTVALTIEPAEPGTPEVVFGHVLEELKKKGASEGVTVERESYSARTVGSSEAADVRVRYRVGAPGLRLVVRSMLILREGASPAERTLVTLTSSYLEEDGARVVPELDRMYEHIELLEPARRRQP